MQTVFESLIVGDGNRDAVNLCGSIGRDQTCRGSITLIYGPSGEGKSHLLLAVQCLWNELGQGHAVHQTSCFTDYALPHPEAKLWLADDLGYVFQDAPEKFGSIASDLLQFSRNGGKVIVAATVDESYAEQIAGAFGCHAVLVKVGASTASMRFEALLGMNSQSDVRLGARALTRIAKVTRSFREANGLLLRRQARLLLAR